MKHKNTDKKIWKLKQEIKSLKQSIDISLDLYEFQKRNNSKLDRERRNYRKIIKYSTTLMLLMNLLTSDNTDTDIGKIIKRNVLEFYRSMNHDLMQIPTDNEDEEFEDEEENEEEGY